MTTMTPSTPSQTVGPYFRIGLNWEDGPYAVPLGTKDACWIRGRVLDGQGVAIDDALIEIWQADPSGHFVHPDDGREVQDGFRGFARSETSTGEFAFYTVVPGAVDELQAPHIDVSVFARGLMQRVVTRIYFPEHAGLHLTDPVLASLPQNRRDTLIATRSATGYRFDIWMQSAAIETVFFDV